MAKPKSPLSKVNDIQEAFFEAAVINSDKVELADFYPVPLRRILDYDTCKKLASRYQSVSDLLANDKSLYGTLRKKGWIHDFFEKQ